MILVPPYFFCYHDHNYYYKSIIFLVKKEKTCRPVLQHLFFPPEALFGRIWQKLFIRLII